MQETLSKTLKIYQYIKEGCLIQKQPFLTMLYVLLFLVALKTDEGAYFFN